MKDISIITVNFNTTDYLDKCLSSVFAFAKGPDIEYIVIDNDSRDKNSLSCLATKYPQIKLISNNRNTGFGAGCNIGAHFCTGKYLLFLNPDIIISDNSIKGLFDYMEEHDDIGLCSSLLTDEMGHLGYSFNYFPSYYWEFKEAFGLQVNTIIKKLLSKPEIKQNEPFEVDWNHGACLMVRREVFEAVKGYDEDFFLYFEDTDLQYRIKKNGYKIMCLPYLKMIHIQRSSVRSDSSRRIYLYYMHISRMLFMKKNYGFIKRNIIRSFFIIGMFLRLISHKFIKRINFTPFQIKMILSIYLNK